MGDQRVEALKGISFSVRPGEFVAIMGASGSGKSTCMNMLGCLDVPTSGDYLLEDVNVGETLPQRTGGDPEQEARLRLPGLQPAGPDHRPGKRRTAAGLRPHPRAARREKAMAALERVGLAGRADHYSNQLSGGQQQRVAIARALVNEPAIILADEPTGNLDSQTTVEIMGIFQELNSQGITIIMVTHEPDIADFTGRHIIFRDGLVISDTRMPRRGAARRTGAGVMSTLLQSLLIAVRALRVNKMRALLTMLGIIIGIAAVIAMVAIGAGASKMISDQISSIGSNLLLVFPGSAPAAACARAGGTARPSPRRCQGDQGRVSVGAEVAPSVRGRPRSCTATRTGRPSSGADARTSWLRPRLDAGSGPQLLTQSDVDGATKNCLIGQTVADNLFGASDPVGKIIRIKKIPFTVIGLLARKGQSPQGQDQDDVIYVPLHDRAAKDLGQPVPNTCGAMMIQAKRRRRPEARRRRRSTALLRPAPPHRPDPRDGLHRQEPLRTSGGLRAVLQGDVDAPWGGRLHLAGGRRDRHHEHHAGLGHRADPGDRHPDGHRRQERGHPAAVPDRGGASHHLRRDHRDAAREWSAPAWWRPWSAGRRSSRSTPSSSPLPSPPESASSSASTRPEGGFASNPIDALRYE